MFYKGEGSEDAKQDRSSPKYNFYKYIQKKSSNKVYNIQKLNAAGIDTSSPKYAARNSNADRINPLINTQRDRFEEETRPKYGDILFSSNFAAGNCVEMASVVMSLCRKDSAFSSKFEKIYYISVNEPGDHVFVALSVDGTRPNWTKIPFMMNEGKRYRNNFWIIDCWLNVACQARDYHTEAQQKLKRWGTQGKEIICQNSAGVIRQYDLNENDYLTQMMGSRLEVKDKDTA